MPNSRMNRTRSPDRSGALTPPSTCCAASVCSLPGVVLDLSGMTRILRVVGEAQIPAWVVPTAQVADCHWIAYASKNRAVCDVLDWVGREQPTAEQAFDRMVSTSGDIQVTLLWLLGMGLPPVQLPRRNPDGSVVSERQLYDEYMADKWGEPEERAEAERKARRDAILYRHLADLVPAH